MSIFLISTQGLEIFVQYHPLIRIRQLYLGATFIHSVGGYLVVRVLTEPDPVL